MQFNYALGWGRTVDSVFRDIGGKTAPKRRALMGQGRRTAFTRIAGVSTRFALWASWRLCVAREACLLFNETATD